MKFEPDFNAWFTKKSGGALARPVPLAKPPSPAETGASSRGALDGE